MTPSLLEHPLVRKYFGDFATQAWTTSLPFPEKEFMALRILDAIQQPIRNGERYLEWDRVIEKVFERISDGEKVPYGNIALRLPDSFQCRCSVQDICRVHPEKAMNRFQTPEKKEMRYCEHILINGCSQCDLISPAPDKASATDAGTLVEEKIGELKHRAEHYWFGKQKRLCVTEEELRELVALARRPK
jgi:hypothetical protein